MLSLVRNVLVYLAIYGIIMLSIVTFTTRLDEKWITAFLFCFGGILTLFSMSMFSTLPDDDLYKTTKEQVKYFLIYTTIGIIGLLMIAFA